MPNDNAKVRTLLSDLGKATLRGVRRCPKCGTYNGTRGLCCKNKACNVVFKEAGEKRKLSTEACKLVTGTSTQVFSVRVRDKGPDYRGFVQLPQRSKTESSAENEVSFITQTSALCFVDTCQRSFDASVLKCHEKSDTVTLTTCQHIQAATRCYADAIPLTLKSTVLTSLNISSDIKETVWLLSNESTGPLVQRVSKNIMAVKCKASPKHPLGYLHFSFFMSRLKDRVENKYFCSCTAFRGQVKHANNRDDPTFKKCVHFYACVWAFASDAKLSEEFAYYINLDKPLVIPTSLSSLDDQNRQLITFLGSDGIPCEVVLQDDTALLDTSGISVSDDTLTEVHGLGVLPTDSVEVQIHDIDNVNGLTFSESNLLSESTAPLGIMAVKRKHEEQPALLTLVEQSAHVVDGSVNNLQCSSSTSMSSTTTSNKKYNMSHKSSLVAKKQQAQVDEASASFSFEQWLASVTERINQTMHFQFNGKPDPLVFLVPQVFFDCLLERISCSTKKKRLPNDTKAFIRKDSPPLGTFTKYIWNITNIMHVKRIFETPLMPLEVTRLFVNNRGGTYEPYRQKNDENEMFRKTHNQPLIKPLELKTFLKVGPQEQHCGRSSCHRRKAMGQWTLPFVETSTTAPNQAEPTPFVIEWVPNVLPESKIGEMKIKFEYGHLRNGQLEKHLPSKTISGLESQTNDDVSVTKI